MIVLTCRHQNGSVGCVEALNEVNYSQAFSAGVMAAVVSCAKGSGLKPNGSIVRHHVVLDLEGSRHQMQDKPLMSGDKT